MNADPSLIAILVAVSVGVATMAGAFAASLIIEATKDAIECRARLRSVSPPPCERAIDGRGAER